MGDNMSLKVKNATEIDKQINDINSKIRIINKELNHIKKINEIIVLNIQEIIDRVHFT